MDPLDGVKGSESTQQEKPAATTGRSGVIEEQMKEEKVMERVYEPG